LIFLRYICNWGFTRKPDSPQSLAVTLWNLGWKVGRSTGVTYAQINGVEATVLLKGVRDATSEWIIVHDQVTMQGRAAEPRDAGAAVWNGLIWGCNLIEGTAFITPMEHIFD